MFMLFFYRGQLLFITIAFALMFQSAGRSSNKCYEFSKVLRISKTNIKNILSIIFNFSVWIIIVYVLFTIITHAISTDYGHNLLNCLCLILSIKVGQICSCTSCCGCANVIVNTTTSIGNDAFYRCGGGYQLVKVIITT